MTAVLKFKQSIANQLSKHTPCNPKDITTFMRPSKQMKEGHISIAVPKLNASLTDPTPKQDLPAWTQSIADNFEPNEFIEKASAQNTNLFFKFREPEFIKHVLQQVYQDNKSYGWSHIPKPNNDTVLIDYSSPNIAKPFHAGHLRSTIIGNFTRIIHESLGYNVIGINYLGDWGKQYGLLAIGFQKYGDESKLVSDPIHHLYEVYVKINADAKDDDVIYRQANEYFKKMEEGDPTALKQWSRFREMSIKSYASIYDRLNVKFDVYSGESQVNPYISKAHDMLDEKKLLTRTEDGAYAVDLETYKLDKAVIRRADGTSLYMTRDLASVLMRSDLYPFQKGIYVVGSEQAGYFKQMFQISKLMMDPSLNLQHIGFGRIKGMSTRKGTVVFLQDILDTAKERILEYMNNDQEKSQMKDRDAIADQLGMSAILIQDMKSKRTKDYEFSWDRMTDAKGDTGVFLQYAHARACGIERKSGTEISPNVDFTILKEKEAMDLVQSIAQFPEIVEAAFASLEPSTLVNYLFKLSHATSVASKFLRVKDMEQDVSKARMLLFWSARITLRNGLYLLGIKPIKQM
ncbi:putative arginine--tRNA ligase, cytoplasmic [Mucor mucedo]|uniref:putative arginine--tRNA ligase, cytoplasmic n=1 Tax=Mucor mucedo TaxID=29922 RepID=UPI00221EEDA1|nr:putative arginine--tRNA ligase, cytoplasmic [Mucor mucedo]KAI7896148.1 putative arginine--tRNA ligase, cytoplasmic [Mucor mucedo]